MNASSQRIDKEAGVDQANRNMLPSRPASNPAAHPARRPRALSLTTATYFLAQHRGRRGTGGWTLESREVCVMQNAATVLDVLRERGRRGLPLKELYRQLFNPQLYLLAYGRLYSNKGAMTPGPDAETADGMTLAKIGSIIDALRHERYRFK